MHIVIAGNIGSGKTTLAGMLAEKYGWEKQFEPVGDNPYLDDYYNDIQRWAFTMEIYLLTTRFRQLEEINSAERTVIQDRSIYEGVYVFTANNHEEGNISDRDYNTYMELYRIMMGRVREPDLMIFLRCSVKHLKDNIAKRGRPCEQLIPEEYLEGLNSRYDSFFLDGYGGRRIIVDADSLDFEHSEKDFDIILDRIRHSLSLRTMTAPSPRAETNTT